MSLSWRKSDQPASARRRTARLVLFVLVGLTFFLYSTRHTWANHGFVFVVDDGGVNQVDGSGGSQSDLTQLGIDDSHAGFLWLQWSWDSTGLWTGNGQTGDACAIFDTDGDGNANYSICVQITNPSGNASKVSTTTADPFFFECTADSRSDRCGSPSSRSLSCTDMYTAGGDTDTQTNNLITATDPFVGGSNYPNDATIMLGICTSDLPTGAQLLNVCSYPSAGNGGNNAPSDCLFRPNAGFLTVIKQTDISTSDTFTFTLSPAAANGANQFTIQGAGTVVDRISLRARSYSLTEVLPPNGWSLDSASCVIGATNTGTFDSSTNRITNLEILEGRETICTFSNLGAAPELTLTKSATPTTYDAVNQIITYSYIVTNTGNVALAGPVTVSDDKIVNPNAVTCPAVNTVGNTDSNLDANESITCTASYAITQADLDSGSVTNTASAAADSVTSNQATATVNAIKNPHLKLVKTGILDMTVVDPDGEANPGDKIGYTLTATNDGNVTLHNVQISDPKLGTLTCTQPVDLAPTAALSCTGVYTLLQTDIDAGQVLNSAKATSTEAPEVTANATVPIPRIYELTLTKAGVLDLTTIGLANRADVGDTIDYTLIVTNTGNTTLHNVTITDSLLASLTCTPTLGSPLAVGAAMQCTGSYTLTQDDIDAGEVNNTATADSNESDPVEAKAKVTVPQAPNLTLSKVGALDMTVVAPPDRADVGDRIDYTLVATNTGNITLHNVTVTDPKLGTLTCTPIAGSTLAVGAVMKCSGMYTLTQTDIDAGQVDNTATADSNESQPTDASAAVPVPQIDHLALTKAGVLDMTAVGPTDRADVGDKISYTLVTTNTGNTTLTGVTIADVKLGTLACTPAAPATLAPGEAMKCTGSYTLIQADIDAGKVDNTANADSDQTNPTPASEMVAIPSAPNIALTKTGLIDRTVVAPTNRADVGDKINYTLVTTNTGNVTLTGVSISDPKLGALACTPTQPTTLLPGASMTCTGSYTITQTDLDAGSFTNTATASGKAPAGTDVSDEETVTKSFGQVVSLALTKSTATVNYDAVNDVINYTLVTTNTGNTTLTNVSISDPKLGTLACTPTQPTTLLPGASMTCTGSHTIVQGDIDAGRFDNTASASGTGPQNQPASAEASKSVPAALAPHLSLSKSAAESSYDAVNQLLHYTLTALNDGNGTLTGVSISDSKLGTLTCNPAQPATLAPGEKLICTGTYAITQADLNVGHVDNTANAAGTDPQNAPVTALPASARVPANQQPELSLSKSAQESSYNAVNQVLHYTLIAANSGNVTLSNVQISDPQVTITSCTPNQPATLTPGQTLTCSGEYTITQADLDAGSFTNTARAQGVDPNQQPVNGGPSSATAPAALAPALTLTKSVQESSYDSPGDVLHYTLTARNDGNVTLASVTIDDAKLGALSCTPAQPATLTPGQALICTGAYTVTQADVDAGQVDNSATAAGDTPGSAPIVTLPATASVPAAQAPHLALTKQAQETIYSQVGDVLHFTLTARNDGNVTLANVSINDPLLPSLTCTPNQPVTLAPGATLVCTGTHTVTQADLDAGRFRNVAASSARDPQGDPVNSTPASATVPASVAPGLSLQKRVAEANYNKVGDVLHFTLTAVNTGNVTLANVSISDPKLASLTCNPAQPATLAPGASLVCTGTHTITQADLDAGSFQNTGTAQGEDPNGDPIDPPQSSVTIDAITPNLSVQKSAFLAEDRVEPEGLSRGDILRYVITMRNLGDGPALDVILSDLPDTNTTLVVGSVTSSKGTITKGNNAGDRSVEINVGTVQSGETITVAFSVQINPNAPADLQSVRNQAIVAISNPVGEQGGQTGTQPSDDPAVEGPEDPTVTPIVAAPTALDEGEEPSRFNHFNYLPLVQTQ
ncbi:MAG: hypothetical protein R3A44_43815 [Caldilineaceae bacterium]